MEVLLPYPVMKQQGDAASDTQPQFRLNKGKEKVNTFKVCPLNSLKANISKRRLKTIH